MVRAIIIDDEQHCIEDLGGLLDGYHDKLTVVGHATNIDDGFEIVITEKPDLVFLDVHLQNSTGFDFLRKFSSPPFEVIFTTAFDKYAVQAFRFSALDYLLKPIEKQLLDEVLHRYLKKEEEKDNAKRYELLLRHIESNEMKIIAIPTEKGLEFTKLEDIIYIKGEKNYSIFYLKEERESLVSKTLKYFEELLPEKKFYRIHKSHIVNTAHVKQYHKGKGGIVIMTNNVALDVSFRKKEGFLRLMKGRL